MTKNCSSYKVFDVMSACLAEIERCAVVCHQGGCRTVFVQCSRCGFVFSEEVRAARSKVVCDEDFLCLACDEDALQSSEVRVTEV